MDTSHRRPSSVFKLVTLLVLSAVFIWLFVARQDVMDWVKLRSYTPSSQIASINGTIGLTEYGQKLFYVNHPEVDTDRAVFAQRCPVDVEKTIVLGCYLSGDNGIYLFDPADERLDGVTEATAAHEMLHAAYDRLPNKERQRIDGLLNDFYKTQLQDERIKKTIASYKKANAPLSNEMHSIFGTEVQNLSPELEAYYTQYFSDRKLVLAQLARYQEEFSKREAQVAAYDAQLAVQKPQIEQFEVSIKANLSRLDSVQDQLTSYQAADNTQAYNALVPRYNDLVNTYNSQLDSLKALTKSYNEIVDLRNSLALEEATLLKSLSGDEQSEVDSL